MRDRNAWEGACCLAVEEQKEELVRYGPQISLFFLRGGAGEGERRWGPELAQASLSAPAAPRAPRGSVASEPALVLGIARGPEPPGAPTLPSHAGPESVPLPPTCSSLQPQILICSRV